MICKRDQYLLSQSFRGVTLGGTDTRGVMTLHDYGYLPPEFLKLPCFGVKFSNIHPASECDFLLSGIFSGESIVMQISFVMLIFLLFSNQFFGGRGKLPGQIA